MASAAQIVTVDVGTLEAMIRDAVRAELLAHSESLTVADPEQLLRIPDAAALVGVTENAFRTAMSRGQVPADAIVKKGASVRIRRGPLLAGWGR